MAFPEFVKLFHLLSLLVMAGAVFAALRWCLARLAPHRHAQVTDKSISVASWSLLLGLLTLAATAGSHVTYEAFRTNVSISADRLAVHGILLMALTLAIVSFHLYVLPWLRQLQETAFGMSLPINHAVALTFDAAVIVSSLSFWITVIMVTTQWPVMATLSAFSLMTLLLWIVFATALLSLIGLNAKRVQKLPEPTPIRRAPNIDFSVKAVPERFSRPALMQ